MITGMEQWCRRVTEFGERYRQWETRRVGQFAGWSVRRRWIVLVLVSTLVFCCGAVIGVPLTWILGTTIEASKGAPTPDAAANEFLTALSYDDEDGLLAVLDNRRQDELLRQFRAYRDAMKTTDPAPSRLDYGALAVGPIVDGGAEVTAEVHATWWDAEGRALSYDSAAYTWRFETREDNGWQVSVEAPAWCGVYVLAEKCR